MPVPSSDSVRTRSPFSRLRHFVRQLGKPPKGGHTFRFHLQAGMIEVVGNIETVARLLQAAAEIYDGGGEHAELLALSTPLKSGKIEFTVSQTEFTPLVDWRNDPMPGGRQERITLRDWIARNPQSAPASSL